MAADAGYIALRHPWCRREMNRRTRRTTPADIADTTKSVEYRPGNIKYSVRSRAPAGNAAFAAPFFSMSHPPISVMVVTPGPKANLFPYVTSEVIGPICGEI